MLAFLADRLVLMPTRHQVDAGGKQRRMIPFGNGHLEAWTLRSGNVSATEIADLFILKFNGNASRAELASEHPADVWADLNCEVWAVNTPGYGGSSGTARLKLLARAADTAYDAIAREAAGRPILVSGNSLGTTMALYLAARHPIAGLLLRNPVPLRMLIYERYGWWNLYLGSGLIAWQVPADLDAVANAQKCRAPALFVQSGADTLVPPAFQRRVIEAYGADSQTFVVEGAEHHTPILGNQLSAYSEALGWLRAAMEI